jgi:hypothetical protein
MSKSQRFSTGDGESTVLNSMQLGALLSMPTTPPQFTSWPTYWALRNRRLIQGAQHTTQNFLTERGKAVLAEYRKGLANGC